MNSQNSIAMSGLILIIGGDVGLKKKVLFIDDDLKICKEIKDSLQNETTDVYYVLSVRDALEQFVKY